MCFVCDHMLAKLNKLVYKYVLLGLLNWVGLGRKALVIIMLRQLFSFASSIPKNCVDQKISPSSFKFLACFAPRKIDVALGKIEPCHLSGREVS